MNSSDYWGIYDENNNLIHSIYTASNYNCDQRSWSYTASVSQVSSWSADGQIRFRVVPTGLVTHPLAIIMTIWKFQLYTLTHLQLQ